jgi:hypothetical protein
LLGRRIGGWLGRQAEHGGQAGDEAQ